MRANKSNAMRALNDVLMYDEAERPFAERLYYSVYDGIINLHCFMTKTMGKRIFDIARAVTTIVIYRMFDVYGRENERHAIAYISQFKSVRVLCNNLCQCLTIHDLPDEILNKVATTGKPLFNFINKNY